MNSWELYDKKVPFESLVGETISNIENSGDQVTLFTQDGKEFLMYHSQDCCESVSVEDIIGDLKDLIGSPITMAEESSNSDNPKSDGYSDSFTWTFYKLATIKGYVTIRWYGSSNGYYSERVDFARIK